MAPCLARTYTAPAMQHRQQAPSAPSGGSLMQRRCVPHASLLPRRGRAVMQALPEGDGTSGGIATAARAAAAIAAAGLLLAAPPALANREKVGEFAASGFIFKDTVEVNAIDDPEVRGVTIYLSDFKRSIVDKMSKDFFAEPSQASLGCAISGPVTILDEKKIAGREGQEVFSEKKGLNLFKDKTLRVRRIYDDERKTLVYVAYSTRLSTAADDGQVTTGRYKTSLCIVSIPPPAAPPVLISPPSDLSVTPPAPTPVAAAQ